MVKIIFLKKIKIINFLIILVLQSCNNDYSLSKYPTKYSSTEDFSKKKEISNENVENNSDKNKKNKKEDNDTSKNNINGRKVLKRYEDPKFEGYECSEREEVNAIFVSYCDISTLDEIFETINYKKSLISIFKNYKNFEVKKVYKDIGLFRVSKVSQTFNEKNEKFIENIKTFPFNTIFVITSFCGEKHIKQVLEEYKSISKCFTESDEFDKKAVVIAIDNSYNRNECLTEKYYASKEEIIKDFSSEGLQNQIIFYSAYESEIEDICDVMYQSASRMRPYTINLTESEAVKELRKFYLYEEERDDCIEKYMKMYRKLGERFI